MGTVNVNGVSYTIHGTLAEAIDYINGSEGSGPAAFMARDDNGRARALVAATRYLFAQRWQGTPTVANQLTAFPRDGVVDQDGNVVLDGTTPDRVKFAEYEMAAIIAGDQAVLSAARTGSNVKRLEAGPVNIEYFRPTDTLDTSTPMPKVVMDLVGQYLASSIEGETGSTAYGVDPCTDSAAESQFEDCDDYERVVR